jgi:hypothetical protein
VEIHLYGNAPHNSIQRQNHAQPIPLLYQDTFHARQSSGRDPRAIANCEVGMGLWFSVIETGPQRFDLEVRQWPSFATGTYK